jgi:hypothetical protein
MIRLAVVVVSCLLLSSCLAAAAVGATVGAAGAAAGATVGAAGAVVGAVVPGGDNDKDHKKRNDH